MGVEAEVGALLHGAVDALGAILADDELLRADGAAHLLLCGLVQSVDVLMVAVRKGDDAALDVGVHDVGASDEGGHEDILRALVDVAGGADVLDDAILHDSDAVTDGHCLFLIVGDIHSGDAHALLGVADDAAHLDTELCVQIGKRLVHQQHVRRDDQRAGQCDALLLAAGQLVGHTVGILHDLHQVQELIRPLLDLGLVHLAVLQAEGHIVPDGEVREDGVVLEHHADVALAGVHIVDPLLIEEDVAALDGVEACDHTEKGGLAAAGGAEQGEQLPISDLQIQIRDDRIIPVALYCVFN